MTATVSDRPHTAMSSRRLFFLFVALGMGGFAVGLTEFVTMGLLPQIADGVHVSIPTAGHVISAYALGVVVGAPTLAIIGARVPRRTLLLALMAAFVLGHVASALASTYGLLLLARFAAGLPHGAYFGVAALVAASLVAPERRGRAVSRVMLGIPMATIIGVPSATWLGQSLGWRLTFWLVAGIGALTLALVGWLVPHEEADESASARNELAAFVKPQVWLTLLAAAIGFGGMFAVFSYIAPTVTDVAGLSQSAVPVFLFALGVGMVAGTWIAGILADWSVFRSLLIGGAGLAFALLLFWALAPYGWWLLPGAFCVTLLASVLVMNLQLRLMDVAEEAKTIGAALNHAALNVANALGAWLGGVVIAAGYGYRSPALVGVALSLVGLGFLVASARLHLKTR